LSRPTTSEPRTAPAGAVGLSFTETLLATIKSCGSRLCVGLDPDLEALPTEFEPHPDEVLRFVTGIVEATTEFAAAYKPNSAFYEVMGPAGMEVLQAVIASVPKEVPVILDAKRGDIANTDERYATACFDIYGATAATVNPYLGRDSLEPFIRRADRGVFVVCRTSNPGSGDVQGLGVGGRPLYLEVAALCREWNANCNIGLVAGATHPADIAAIRAECPGMPILVPGVGPQAGDLEAAAAAAVADRPDQPFLISASRAIMSASLGADFQHAAADAARGIRDRIEAVSRIP
jgi:orotidine-5'-phosphate decarboxylase